MSEISPFEMPVLQEIPPTTKETPRPIPSGNVDDFLKQQEERSRQKREREEERKKLPN